MAWPATALTWVMQERMGWPSASTVHAPHTPMPQPYLAPLRLSMSRRTHKRGMSGGTSTVATTLLIVSFRGICLLHNPRAERHRSLKRDRDWSGVYRISAAAFQRNLQAHKWTK